MKTQILFFTCLFIIAQQGIIQAQDDRRKDDQPDFNTWTEEKIRNWEDSIRKSINPDLVIQTAVKKDDKVDEDTTTVIRGNNTYVPNSVTIDKNKAVGEIPMMSSVSQTGAITYSIPIEVYSRQRVQPQLSIVYNSNSGNGVLGKGWGISGLSSVIRGNRSLYYDDREHGVNMTKDDAFYLDGMRLIKISETSTQIKYESEHGNIKATANLNGTLVKYFDVFFPNGTKGTFGYTSNTSTAYLEYPLTSLSDLYGNTLTYTYTYINGHYRITKISYDNASVEFQYRTDTRTDVVTFYSGGIKVSQDKLLQKIICKYGSTVLRNYEFTYSLNKNTSVLTEVGYSAASGASLNPLKFYYGENNNTSEYSFKKTNLLEYYIFTNLDQVKIKKGKFDYGTEDDGLIVLPEKSSYWQHRRPSSLIQHSQDRFDNYYTGTEKILLYTGINDDYPLMPNLTTGEGFIDILCANLDAVYEDEVIKVNNKVSGSNDQVVFTSYTANLYYGLALKHTRTFNFPTVLTDNDGGKSVHPKFYFTGNFTGDGKMKVLAISCNKPFGWSGYPTKCYLFDLESNSKLYDGQPFEYNHTFWGTNNPYPNVNEKNSDKLFMLDYDGDGKTDICLINTQGTYIYTFDVTGSSCTMRQVAFYSGLKRVDLDDRIFMIGEFNGDGKPDFLLSPKVGNSDWYIFYSMGNGQFEKVAVSIYSRNSSYSYILQDINSDGLTDVIEYTATGFYTYRAVNGKFSSYESYTAFTTSNPVFISTDVNSSNYHSKLVALKDGEINLFSYPRNDTKEKLLTGSVTSLGVVTKNYYNTLLKSSGIHLKGADAVYPYLNFQGPIFVSESREQYFNGQINENLSYYYENAVIHNQGLGYRGFAKITTYDNIRGRTGYQKFAPYKYCELVEDDSPDAKNTYTYSSTVTNKIVKLRLTSQSVQDKLKGITITTGYTYDTYGSPLTQTINYGGGITNTVTNTYFNNTNESGYLLGFPTDITTTVVRNGSSWANRSLVSSHDSKGQPTTVIQYSNGIQISLKTFTYDSKGRKKSHVVKPYTSSKTLTTSYDYDSYGRMTKQTDPMGLITTYEYDAVTGSLFKEKNYLNLVTEYYYDVFFRNNKIITPDGATGQTVFAWNSSNNGSLLSVTSSATKRPTQVKYTDALGRTTREGVQGFNGTYSHIDYLYDSYGRVQKKSDPYTSTARYSVYEYDTYDRPKKITSSSGRVTTTTYSNNTVTTVDDGMTTSKTYDASGALIQATDPVGTITYTLRPDGQPSSIKTPDNALTEFEYDTYGRQIKLIDPSAGTIKYEYNSEGLLFKNINARNQTIEYNQYTDWGQPKKIITPEQTIDYTYNTTYKNRLDNIAVAGLRYVITYGYDALGRINKKTETDKVNGTVTFTKEYTYDAGLLKTEKYNNTDVLTYEYNSYGYMNIMKFNSTTIYTANSRDHFGQLTQYTYGNSYVTTNTYSDYGSPKTIKATMNGVNLVDQSYTFDDIKGLLTKRNDIANGGGEETFLYDNLRRLTNYGNTSKVYNSVGYSSMGNITSKTDAGTLLYNVPNKPYAVGEQTPPAQQTMQVRYIRDIINGSNINTGNHWVEIQAINGSGANVALGKSVVGTSSITSPNLITDGSTLSEPYAYTSGSGAQTITLDLGAINNLKDVKIWHYYKDWRNYNGSKTEISTNGTTWTTLHDASVNGVYKETLFGKSYGPNTGTPLSTRDITFTSTERPNSITTNGLTTNIFYNHAGIRTMMMMNTHVSTSPHIIYYFGGNYEREVRNASVTERLYLGGSSYSAPAVAIRKDNGAWAIHYIHRDYLGSIVAVSNASGAAVEKRSYDAWGRLRKPNSLQPYGYGEQPTLFLNRGYTGHEHLPEFGLINMNARMYDPVIGRFLSPDPYVQMPDFSQSFNRYSYCINNPLIYTDLDGEIFGRIFKWFRGTVSTAVIDFVDKAFLHGGFDITSPGHMRQAWRDFDPTAPWSKTNKAFKIDMGKFKTDENGNFWERTWQLTSRHTWERPQSWLGNNYTNVRNILGHVDRVDYLGGATWATRENDKRRGFSLGNYINMNIEGEITGSFRDHVLSDPWFMHEYGHYIQSRHWGPLYLIGVGIPSARAANNITFIPGDPLGRTSDDIAPIEMKAHRRAAKYFGKHYGVIWDYLNEDNDLFWKFPLYYP